MNGRTGSGRPTAGPTDGNSSGGGGGGSVSSVFANGVNTGAVQLATLPAASLSSSTIAWVATVGDYFGLRPSTATVDGLNVIAASGRPGYQWVRLSVRNRAWEQRTTWLVDPQNVASSDENTGLAGSPLKTLTELSRRLVDAIIATTQLVTVTLVSDCLVTDKPVWSVTVQPGANSGDGMLITGVPTVIYTGSLTAAFVQQTQGNVAAANDNQMTDAAIPVSYTASGLIGAGLLWQRTNGTALFWHGIKDLTAKTARISDPKTAAGVITALVNGDTYTVSQLPKYYDQSFERRAVGRALTRFEFQFCDSRATTTTATGPNEGAELTFDRCTFSTATSFVQAVLLNCGLWALCGQNGPGNVFMNGGAVVGGGTFGVINGGTLTFSGSGSPHFQGTALAASQGSFLNAVFFIFYDVTAFDCVTLTNAQAFFNNFKGKGNTLYLLTASVGGIFTYNHTTVPPLLDASTSQAASIKTGGGATGTQGLAANLPMSASLVTVNSGIVATTSIQMTVVVMKFSGGLLGGAGATTGYLADTGLAPAVNFAAVEYSVSQRTINRLRVKPQINTFATNVVITVFKNGVATAITTAIPAGSTAVVTDLSHFVTFVDGDLLAVVLSNAGDAAKTLTCMVTVEGY